MYDQYFFTAKTILSIVDEPLQHAKYRYQVTRFVVLQQPDYSPSPDHNSSILNECVSL